MKMVMMDGGIGKSSSLLFLKQKFFKVKPSHFSHWARSSAWLEHLPFKQLAKKARGRGSESRRARLLLKYGR